MYRMCNTLSIVIFNIARGLVLGPSASDLVVGVIAFSHYNITTDITSGQYYRCQQLLCGPLLGLYDTPRATATAVSSVNHEQPSTPPPHTTPHITPNTHYT